MRSRGLLVLLGLLLLSSTIFAQKSILSGVVVDGETGDPVEFASIGVFNPTDSTLIKVGITDALGVTKI